MNLNCSNSEVEKKSHLFKTLTYLETGNRSMPMQDSKQNENGNIVCDKNQSYADSFKGRSVFVTRKQRPPMAQRRSIDSDHMTGNSSADLPNVHRGPTDEAAHVEERTVCTHDCHTVCVCLTFTLLIPFYV
ncbi:hypothetical protein AMECASPLE_022465 [Ameca splendens]|uniref:Uncharacterized protein n=1 Tax=Ameca splendens TaxID=208324 RepID=A0ABV0YFS9_9TELE